jgi:hypothetical protein
VAEAAGAQASQRLGAAQPQGRRPAVFVKQVGRKAQKGVELNDCSYSRKAADAFRRMSTAQLDELLRDGDE